MFCKFKKNMIYETKMKNITICFYFKRKQTKLKLL